MWRRNNRTSPHGDQVEFNDIAQGLGMGGGARCARCHCSSPATGKKTPLFSGAFIADVEEIRGRDGAHHGSRCSAVVLAVWNRGRHRGRRPWGEVVGAGSVYILRTSQGVRRQGNQIPTTRSDPGGGGPAGAAGLGKNLNNSFRSRRHRIRHSVGRGEGRDDSAVEAGSTIAAPRVIKTQHAL
jgi:hypothetical protein